jgi:hypothetical protein
MSGKVIGSFPPIAISPASARTAAVSIASVNS